MGIALAKNRDNVYEAARIIRGSDNLSTTDRDRLATWLIELHVENNKRRVRDKKRNKKRRNDGSDGRPQYKKSDQWIGDTKLYRVITKYEALLREGKKQIEAETIIAKEFVYPNAGTVRSTISNWKKRQRANLKQSEDFDLMYLEEFGALSVEE